MRFSLLYPEKLRAYFEDRSKLFEFPQGALDLSMLCPGIQMKIDLEITIFSLAFQMVRVSSVRPSTDIFYKGFVNTGAYLLRGRYL